jgi:hypothetical protein
MELCESVDVLGVAFWMKIFLVRHYHGSKVYIKAFRIISHNYMGSGIIVRMAWNKPGKMVLGGKGGRSPPMSATIIFK